jgi:nitric oxide reductase NorD protein
MWGEVKPPVSPTKSVVTAPVEITEDSIRPRMSKMRRRPQVREASEGEDDDTAGMWMIQLDEPQEHVEDPMGLSRPTDLDGEADPEGLADSLSELPEARLVTTPERAKEILVSNDPPGATTEVARGPARQEGFVYPEWDYRKSRYHEHGAVVRVRPAPLGDAQWAQRVFGRRALLLGEVRRRFERLRARRLRIVRQLDGPEFDLNAYVASLADRRAGLPIDDRLYIATRSARRDVAVTVLVDTSGSTDSWATEDLRIVDVEKEALLVVATALDALGDPFAILSFSGESRADVSVSVLKAFTDPAGPLLHQRIAGLEPDRFTRLGAAVRHATSMLVQRPAHHRLLLVISDGKPNDMDIYEGRYGVEDTRQAVREAQLQGIHPFCLTVDRQAPSYMPRMLGRGKYAVLPHPTELPAALVQVLRILIKA